MLKLPKVTSLVFLCNILKKKWVMKLIFWNLISMKACYKLILWFWWGWSSIPKLTCLQCLYNMSKKKLGMDFIFCMQINIKVSTSWHYCFWWKWSDMSKVLKIESWQYFCNIFRKKCRNCFCILLWCKTFRYFTGVQSCSLLLVFGSLWSEMSVAFTA